jgi:hypothetical protein
MPFGDTRQSEMSTRKLTYTSLSTRPYIVHFLGHETIVAWSGNPASTIGWSLTNFEINDRSDFESIWQKVLRSSRQLVQFRTTQENGGQIILFGSWIGFAKDSFSTWGLWIGPIRSQTTVFSDRSGFQNMTSRSALFRKIENWIRSMNRGSVRVCRCQSI